MQRVCLDVLAARHLPRLRAGVIIGGTVERVKRISTRTEKLRS